MALIVSAAHLRLCSHCKQHGWVVCADGTLSLEFFTRPDGLEEAARLAKAGKIASDEMLELHRQIIESAIPPSGHTVLRMPRTPDTSKVLLPESPEYVPLWEYDSSEDIRPASATRH